MAIERRTPTSEPLDSSEAIEVGQWYWVTLDYEEAKEYLSCVIHVGSNYVEFDPVTKHDVRVHLDDFGVKCRRELDPDSIINQQIASAQAETKRLMGEVNDVTARLALGAEPGLGSGSEGQALARLDQGVSADAHKKALILAKKTTLPALFEQIESSNRRLATWMTAKTIPLQASAKKMQEVLGVIEGRIFNVELYAGLTEQVKQVCKGEPAGVSEKVHLMQRMHYMDEECLVRYETGGMVFNDIQDFDAWVKKNYTRILPHPKTVVAFRVRRNPKEHNVSSLREFIQLILEEDYDKTTFLYIRNGDRVYRMTTSLKFDAKLFPDMAPAVHSGETLWAEKFGGSLRDSGLITQGEYDEMKQADAEEERIRQENYDRAPKKERYKYQFSIRQRVYDYEPFNQSSVLYDDILRRETKAMEKHNRIVLILQGLLDRSEVFHPHPAWRIWTPEGFAAALELVYDDTRALVAGPKPDFEAYRKRLGATITKGTVTIGQDRFWAKQEAEKEQNRRPNREYWSTEYRPHGNPGPGKLARVAEATKTKCTYHWLRARLTYDPWNDTPIPCKIQVPRVVLFNADAYTPGDFKQFYDDPRTRAEYLKWAPMLLLAEEYKAGNREVGSRLK